MSMRRIALLIPLCFSALLLAFPACHRVTPLRAPTSNIPVADPKLFDAVELKSRLSSVQSALGSLGEMRKHDDLPATPKPLELYPKLPADTQYWLWTGADHSILILGLGENDRVVFKESVTTRDGATINNALIDESYQ